MFLFGYGTCFGFSLKVIFLEMSFPDQNPPNSGTLIYVYNNTDSIKPAENGKVVDVSTSDVSRISGAPGAPKATFSCDFCLKTFKNKGYLRRHKMTHQLKKSYNCKDCSSSFNNLDNLLLHMVTHKMPPVRCPRCKILFHRRSSLQGHIKSHFKGEYLMCSECGDVFSYEGQFRKHFRECLGKNKRVNVQNFTCQVCSKTFGTKSVLDRHTIIHSGVKPFQCEECRQCFTQKNSLEIHKMTHNNTRPHQCPKCPLSFIQKVNLQCHLRRVHCPEDPKRFPCTKCSCNFKKLSALSLHVKKTHQEVEQKPKTQEIREKYVQFTEYRQDGSTVQHAVKEISSAKGKFLQCNFCPRKQRNLSSWLHHRRHHVKCPEKVPEEPSEEPEEEEPLTEKRTERVYQCSRCPENFYLKTQFQFHLRQHNKEMTLERRLKAVNESGVARPHACSLCPMRFTKNCHLREHMMRHQNVRPFQCATCGKTFATRAILEVHGRSHTGQKPFRCSKCDKMFSTASACRRHSEVHSVAKNYECERCGKRFKTLESFRKHLLIHDGAIVEVPKAEETENPVQVKEKILSQPIESLPSMDFTEMEDNQPRTYIVILDDQQFDPVGGYLQPELSPNLIKINPIEGEGESTTVFSWTPQKRQKIPEECDLPPLKPISDIPEAQEATEQSGTEKNYKKCPNCPKKFLKPIDLRRHLRTHTGERPFSCEECGKTYSLESTLKKHRQIHRTNKPKFTCLTCLKDFSSKDNLKMHQTVHTGEKPFECLYCEKHFRTMSNRNAHHSTHLKRINSTIQAEAKKSSPVVLLNPDDLPPLVPIQSSKEFPCKFCGKLFNQSALRLKHELLHSREQFLCEKCSETFISKSSLELHQKHCDVII